MKLRSCLPTKHTSRCVVTLLTCLVPPGVVLCLLSGHKEKLATTNHTLFPPLPACCPRDEEGGLWWILWWGAYSRATWMLLINCSATLCIAKEHIFPGHSICCKPAWSMTICYLYRSYISLDRPPLWGILAGIEVDLITSSWLSTFTIICWALIFNLPTSKLLIIAVSQRASK